MIQLLTNNGSLPTRSASIPATSLQECGRDKSKLSNYYLQFIAQWYLSYERISVPANQRIESTQKVLENELVPKANRLIEKYPGIGQDVIWEAWDLGLENYMLDNGKSAFPMFNFAVLIFFINKYRHAAMNKLHPELVAEKVKELPSSLPTMRELLAAIRNMPAEQLDLMLELQSPAYQPLFLHLANKMSAESPERYAGLKNEAKALWVVKVAAGLGVDPAGLVTKDTKDIIAQWEARFRKNGAMAMEDVIPSLYTDWRRLLLIDAEVFV